MPWCLKSIIKDILTIALNFDAISFQHVFREANFTVDSVTSIGHLTSSLQTCINGLSLNALTVFNHDSFDLGCPRGFKL